MAFVAGVRRGYSVMVPVEVSLLLREAIALGLGRVGLASRGECELWASRVLRAAVDDLLASGRCRVWHPEPGVV